MSRDTEPIDIFEMILESRSKETVAVAKPSKGPHDWHESEEGQLAVDIIDAGENIVLVSTVAGCDIDKLEIFIHNDLITLRGVRVSPALAYTDAFYHHKECFWGTFSRTIVLPVHVQGYKAQAEYRFGVLTITIPKLHETPMIPVTVVEE